MEEQLAAMRRKLLDLTSRNRLLKFRPSPGKSLQFVAGDVSCICAALLGLAPSPVNLLPLPEPKRTDWIERNDRSERPDPVAWAQQNRISTAYDLVRAVGAAGSRANLQTLMYADILAKHCRGILREARSAIDETGANMLFLAIGFLEFPDQRQSDRTLSAPLVLIPVALVDSSRKGRPKFHLEPIDEEVVENACLREKLSRDFELLLPELQNDSGEIEPETYLGEVRRLVRDQPGFAVRQRITLGLFSFTNMLLHRDLEPGRWPEEHGKNLLLDASPLVGILASAGRESESLGAPLPDRPAEEDPAKGIPLVFDADSSQHQAIANVIADGRSMVIQGPPGTGKSQVIANLMAASLRAGKKVLFVAEKMAALEVVRNRLEQAGLGPFLLNLHVGPPAASGAGDKTSRSRKRQILDNLQLRLDLRPRDSHELPSALAEAEARRRELKAHADLMGSIVGNQFGLTLCQLIWRTERHRRALQGHEALLNRISLAEPSKLTEQDLVSRTECLARLASYRANLGPFDRSQPFWGWSCRRLFPGDEDVIEAKLVEALSWAPMLAERAIAYERIFGKSAAFEPQQVGEILTLLQEFSQSIDPALPMELLPEMLRAEADDGERIERLARQIEEYGRLCKRVSIGLLIEAPLSTDLPACLDDLRKAANTAGSELGRTSELPTWIAEVATRTERGSSAWRKLEAACRQVGVRCPNSAEELTALVKLVALATSAPAISPRTPALTEPGCEPAITALARGKAEWQFRERALRQVLYLDHLPPAAEVVASILALRQFRGCMRFFHSPWRAAARLHRGLVRDTRRRGTANRLRDLECLDQVTRARQAWLNSDTWRRFLEPIAPSDAVNLDELLEVYRWKARMRRELEASGKTADLATAEQVKAAVASIQGLATAVSEAAAARAEIESLLPNFASDGATLAETAEQWVSRCSAVAARLPEIARTAVASATVADLIDACRATVRRRQLAEWAAQGRIECLGNSFRGIETDIGAAVRVWGIALQLRAPALAPVLRLAMEASAPTEAVARVENLLRELTGYRERLQSFVDDCEALDLKQWVGTAFEPKPAVFAASFTARIEQCAAKKDVLLDWSRWLQDRDKATALGLSKLLACLEDNNAPGEIWADACAYCAFRGMVREAFQASGLAERGIGEMNEAVAAFRASDAQAISLRGRAVASAAVRAASPPAGTVAARVSDLTEMRLIDHLLPQPRPRVRMRQMLSRAAAALQELQPCFLMSPQAVAQYLEPGKISFDLVVMDEASQLRPEKAIGAIARGRQIVVVGDSNQLPPTEFFSRSSQQADETELLTTDSESILDVCASVLPQCTLRWHYRSRHESLIAFSNQQFYRGNLIVLPTPMPAGDHLGVRAIYLADAVYENRRNVIEARRTVDLVVEHIRERPHDSIGVVTFNVQQRDLIAELLWARLESVPEAEEFQRRWASEMQPVFVKNLENVQGDERDSIIISTTFGRSVGSGAVQQTFGPINQEGGWRRLNVLFTRARKSITLATSLKPEDIVVGPGDARGRRVFRDYLEYVRTGRFDRSEETGRGPDSDFEIAVGDVLRSRNLEITPQLGVGGYRIDIAVRHPDIPGTYLAAIECDGASYHSSRSARDRDRIRQEVLEGLGWKGRIWRIWSTDWFRNPARESAKLLSFLEEIRLSCRTEHRAASTWTVESTPSDGSVNIAENEIPFAPEDDREVEVGDMVSYRDETDPGTVKTVQIARERRDLKAGIVSSGAPLARCLLGTRVGETVAFAIPGATTRSLCVLGISRPNPKPQAP